MGEDVSRRRAGRPRRPRAQRRLRPRRRRRPRPRRALRAGCWPTCRSTPTPACRARSPPNRRWRDPGAVVPDDPRKVYDVRDVDRAGSSTPARCWSRAALGALIVTALRAHRRARRSAWSPTSRASSAACSTPSPRRRARASCETCDAFGIPLVVLVDTPGFMPGTRQEQAGVIRFGAKLVRAFAAATVPRITVILRKAYGGAYITMNSKDLGADLVFAWPSAEIGVMGAQPAVGIIHRRELAAAEDPIAARARARRRLRRGAPRRATSRPPRGFVDEVIEPAETRRAARARRCSTTGRPARRRRSSRDGPRRQARPRHGRHHEATRSRSRSPSEPSRRARRSC